MENWTQMAAALSLGIALVAVLGMSLLMSAMARYAERRAEQVYLEATGLAYSLARSRLRGIELGIGDRRCPSCHGAVNVMMMARDHTMSEVANVSCSCGLCACRLGLHRSPLGLTDDDELI